MKKKNQRPSTASQKEENVKKVQEVPKKEEPTKSTEITESVKYQTSLNVVPEPVPKKKKQPTKQVDPQVREQ